MCETETVLGELCYALHICDDKISLDMHSSFQQLQLKKKIKLNKIVLAATNKINVSFTGMDLNFLI